MLLEVLRHFRRNIRYVGLTHEGMGLRVFPTGRYRVFYKVVEDSGIVVIVRVLYARRDVVKAFSEKP